MADCGHLPDDEFGVYMKLLIAMWRAPNQRLPNDDQWLARRFVRSVEAVRQTIRPLIQEFCQTDGNWITQKRLLREFAFVSESRKKQSDRAKSRWNKENGLSRGNAASGNAPTPTPTPTPLKKESKKPPETTLNGHTAEFEEWYSLFPLHKGRGEAEKAFVKAIAQTTAGILNDGARRYAAEVRGREARYIAHPATWLNGKRWLDEPAKPRNLDNGMC
jgi:uncharacterized protein YdaU (DUF1376 family)